MLRRSCSDLTRVALGRAGEARGNRGRRGLGKGGGGGSREREKGRRAREDFAHGNKEMMRINEGKGAEAGD